MTPARPTVDVDKLAGLLAARTDLQRQWDEMAAARQSLTYLSWKLDVNACEIADHPALPDLLAHLAAVTAERDEARAAVERVRAICEQDVASRQRCAESDDRPPDCYECGKWHNCTHTPLTAIRAALDAAPAPTDNQHNNRLADRVLALLVSPLPRPPVIAQETWTAAELEAWEEGALRIRADLRAVVDGPTTPTQET